MDDDDPSGGNASSATQHSCRCEEHHVSCYGCGVCYKVSLNQHNAILRAIGDQPLRKDFNDGDDFYQPSYGSSYWFCQNCDSKLFKGFAEKISATLLVDSPPDWFQSCINEITSKISDLEIKLSTEVNVLAADLNAYKVEQKQDLSFSNSPVRKRPTPASAWGNVDVHSKQLDINDIPVPKTLITPPTLTDHSKDSQLSQNVKINVKCRDFNSRSSLLKSISKDSENFPNFLCKSKSDYSVDILVNSFAKARLAKEALEKKMQATVSNPISLNSRLYNISSIPYDISEEEALQSLVKENPKFNFDVDKSNDFSVFAKTNPNARLTVKKVVQCRSGMYRIIANITEPLIAILDKQGLIVEHTMCKLYEISKHNMCFKCLLPGHLAKNCQNNVVCSRCSGEHSFNECKSDFTKCIFCVRNNRSDHIKIKCKNGS